MSVVADGARRTEDGVATVQRAREAFEAIGLAIEEVSSRAGGIATAVETLAGEAGQMAEDVVGAASAQQLATSAGQLEELVATFKLS